MEHVLTMIEAGCYADGSPFDPEMDEAEYYDECDPDSEMVGATIKQEKELIPEPTYDDDDYEFIDHKDPQYDGVRDLWCDGDGGLMPHEKAEKEYEFFTGSSDLQC